MTRRETIFITGASSGIGEALARFYAARGATLGLVARRAQNLSALADELKASASCDVYCYPLDVADEKALFAAAADFINTAGCPDIVIASAGVSSGTLTESPDDLLTFRRIFDINVYGMAASFSPFIHAMKAHAANGARCRLVGIASVAGIRGLPGSEAYSASKSAVITYLESLRLELARSGIKVVTLVPGFIKTPMTAVNTYPMPFLTPVEKAVIKFAHAIEAGQSYRVVPWQMGIVAKILRLMPNPVYDWLFANAPRKSKTL